MVKAVQYREHGSSDVVKIIDDYELPQKLESEVRVTETSRAKPAYQRAQGK